MTTGEFYNAIRFSRIETYSFNRGAKLDSFTAAARELFRQKHHELLTAPPAELPLLRGQLRLLERTHDIQSLSLTEGLSAFHLTATPIAVIQADSLLMQQLAELLRIPVVTQSDWMCWPTYRDALAFYDEQGQLVKVLNICFGCDGMLSHTGEIIQADTTAYLALRTFLIQLGHPIAEN
jgi:hypothetical protein